MLVFSYIIPDFFGSGIFTGENVTFLVAIGGAIFTLFSFVYKQIESYNNLTKIVEQIKKEVTVNGGSTLKDGVNKLSKICERIETHQKVLDQRSRLSLHLSDIPLFEINKDGHLIWANDSLVAFLRIPYTELCGNDWLAIINDRDTEGFIKELTSCIHMCRKFEFTTTLEDGRTVTFVAHPYKISDSNHDGFLVKIVKYQT